MSSLNISRWIWRSYLYNALVPLLLVEVVLVAAYLLTNDIIRIQASYPISCIDRETKKYGTNHPVIGYLLARHWRLSESQCLAIYLHHHASCNSLQDTKLRAMIVILKIANQLINQPLGMNESSLESIQYITYAKSELMLKDETFDQLRQDAMLGFH